MENAIQTYTGRTELEIRRTLPDNACVRQSLTGEEYNILQASCRPHINELPEYEVVEKMRTQIRLIALDTGYHIPSDATTWQYISTRIYTFIREHFGWLSLADIKYAFDLLALGRLDEYLPKNSYGTPERSHYQAFTPEYFAKVLNAYRNVQEIIIGKARTALPEAPKKKTNEGEKYWNAQMRKAFYEYKYRGKFELSPYLVLYILKYLRSIHYDVDIEITESDKKRAFYDYLRLASQGMKNENEAVYVRRKGIEAEELRGAVMNNAQLRLIKEYFDERINN